MSISNHWSQQFHSVPGCSAQIAAQLDQLVGSLFMRAGSEFQDFQSGGGTLLFLTSGRIRVQAAHKPGPHIRYFQAGSDISQVFTNACLLSQIDSRSRVIAESDVHAVTLDQDAFTTLMIASQEFRALLHRLCGQRIINLLRQDTESRHRNHHGSGTPTTNHLL